MAIGPKIHRDGDNMGGSGVDGRLGKHAGIWMEKGTRVRFSRDYFQIKWGTMATVVRNLGLGFFLVRPDGAERNERVDGRWLTVITPEREAILKKPVA